MSATWEIREGDALERLREMPDESVQCCVTSPPYFGLRDYGVAGQIGLESTPDEFVAALVAVFRDVRRVLRSTSRVSASARREEDCERLAAVRRYAQMALNEATDPNGDDYEPGDENTADMLISARWILTLCDGKNA